MAWPLRIIVHEAGWLNQSHCRSHPIVAAPPPGFCSVTADAFAVAKRSVANGADDRNQIEPGGHPNGPLAMAFGTAARLAPGLSGPTAKPAPEVEVCPSAWKVFETIRPSLLARGRRPSHGTCHLCLIFLLRYHLNRWSPIHSPPWNVCVSSPSLTSSFSLFSTFSSCSTQQAGANRHEYFHRDPQELACAEH